MVDGADALIPREILETFMNGTASPPPVGVIEPRSPLDRPADAPPPGTESFWLSFLLVYEEGAYVRYSLLHTDEPAAVEGRIARALCERAARYTIGRIQSSYACRFFWTDVIYGMTAADWEAAGVAWIDRGLPTGLFVRVGALLGRPLVQGEAVLRFDGLRSPKEIARVVVDDPFVVPDALPEDRP